MKLQSTLGHGLSSTALSTEGEQAYQNTRKLMRFHDGLRERGLSTVGYMPYAYPIGGSSTQVTTTAQALATSGGSIAVPVALEGHMLLESVVFWNTDATLTRGPVEFGIHEDRLNNANALNLVAAGTLATWTSAAGLRTIPTTNAPIYLAPGVYWAVIKNNSTTQTLGLGSTPAGTMAQSVGQTKTLGTAALAATLDFATWVKATYLPGIRLNGRVFGQTVAF